MKKIQKRMYKIINEMTKNACDDIGYPFDETCTETVINDLKHTFEIEITDDTRITYQLLNTIAECVETYAIATEFNFSDVIIEHYEKSQNK